MNQIFENRKRQVEDHINSLSESAILSDQIEEEIFGEFQLKAPNLKLDETKTTIESEVITFENAPPDISFTPGRPMEVAVFKVPIYDPTGVFNAVTRSFSGSRTFYADRGNLYYKAYSPNGISGNKAETERLKEEAKKRINSVKSTLDSFEVECDDFNENQLKQFVSSTIKNRKDKIQRRKSSEDDLNPFS